MAELSVKTNTVLDRTEQVTVMADLEGISRLSVPHRPRRPVQWQPDTALLRWTRQRRDDQPWTPWSLTGAISGPELKQDGTLSKRTYSERFYWAGATPGDLPTEVWEWVLSTRPADESDA